MFHSHRQPSSHERPSGMPRDPRSASGVLATHHAADDAIEMQPMHGGDPYEQRVAYLKSPSVPVGSYGGYNAEPGSWCSQLSIFWLVVAIASAVLVIAGAAAAIVVALNYATTGEETVVEALTLGMNLQREALRGMRVSQLCLLEKQIQCAADGLGAAACGATAAELNELCPLPPMLLDLLSESNVESALDESNTDAESQFASQQSELY